MGTPGQAAPQQVSWCGASGQDAAIDKALLQGMLRCCARGSAWTRWLLWVLGNVGVAWELSVEGCNQLARPGNASALGHIPESCRQAERSVPCWDALRTHETDCCGGAMLGCKTSMTQAPYECRALHRLPAHEFHHVQPHWLRMNSGGALSEGHSSQFVLHLSH